MKKHISYPKIQQFRNTVADINRAATFIGVDGDGNAIYDQMAKKPTVTFKGTVKLHGTNASVCFNSNNGFWVQSRKNIITPYKDNAGFAFFAESNKVQFCALLDEVINEHQIDTKEFTVSIYGEWAGKGVQKAVGISQLPKAFYIFGVKVSKPGDSDFKSYWLPSSHLRNKECGIFNVEDYQTFSVDVDFNMPQLAINEFTKITEAVEKECPISKALGIDGGVGEGVVWAGEYKGSVYRFKVKGEKHSSSKVKTLASVDVEKLKTVQDFVEYAVTKSRFDQAIENVFAGDSLNTKGIGSLIRWTINDIIAEESDTMNKNNLEPKDVNKYISGKVREMFFEEMDRY